VIGGFPYFLQLVAMGRGKISEDPFPKFSFVGIEMEKGVPASCSPPPLTEPHLKYFCVGWRRECGNDKQSQDFQAGEWRSEVET